jgi:hypothetical protein
MISVFQQPQSQTWHTQPVSFCQQEQMTLQKAAKLNCFLPHFNYLQLDKNKIILKIDK